MRLLRRLLYALLSCRMLCQAVQAQVQQAPMSWKAKSTLSCLEDLFICFGTLTQVARAETSVPVQRHLQISAAMNNSGRVKFRGGFQNESLLTWPGPASQQG